MGHWASAADIIGGLLDAGWKPNPQVVPPVSTKICVDYRQLTDHLTKPGALDLDEVVK
jgi:hypothetical protein